MQLNTIALGLPFHWMDPLNSMLKAQKNVANAGTYYNILLLPCYLFISISIIIIVIAGPAAFSMDCAVGDVTNHSSRPFYFRSVNNLAFPLFLIFVAGIFAMVVKCFQKKTIRTFRELVETGQITVQSGPQLELDEGMEQAQKDAETGNEAAKVIQSSSPPKSP